MTAEETYKDTAVAGREAIERAIQMRERLEPRDFRVLLACLYLTALFSRTTTTTSLGQLSKLAGVSRTQTSKSIGRLNDFGVIAWGKSNRRGKANSRLSIIDTHPNPERMMGHVVGQLRRPREEPIDIGDAF